MRRVTQFPVIITYFEKGQILI